jgi:signal transduction histidine kinase
VEAAAYYVVAEALTNVAKYADASGARVSVERADGRLAVTSEPGHGTTVRAELPLHEAG